MPISAPFASPSSGLSTSDVDAEIASALLATNLVRVLRCRFYVASLPAFTASGSGVGKTLTANANGALSADSNTPSVGDRILYPASSAHAGVYNVTTVGSAGTPWVLTRATDFDDDADVLSNMVVQVTEGSTYADTSWQLTTNDPITVDTTSLSWSSYMPNANTSLTLRGLTLTGSAAELSLAGNLFLTVNSPSEITSNQSAYTLTDGYTHYRLSTDASRTIYGISGSNNKVALIENIGSNNLVLANESGSAGAASQRILTGTGSDLTLATNQCAIIIYDPTSSRWRVLASTAAAALSNPTNIDTARIGSIAGAGGNDAVFGNGTAVDASTNNWGVRQQSDGELYLNASSSHTLWLMNGGFSAGNGIATIDGTGLNVRSGKTLTIDSVPVCRAPLINYQTASDGGSYTQTDVTREVVYSLFDTLSPIDTYTYTLPGTIKNGQLVNIAFVWGCRTLTIGGNGNNVYTSHGAYSSSITLNLPPGKIVTFVATTYGYYCLDHDGQAQYTGATTDATPTTIATIDLPANQTSQVEVWVTARRTGGTSGSADDGASYGRVATFKQNAGTATQIGSTTALVDHESQSGWDVTLSASGGNCIVQVTGAANNNVSWRAHVKTRHQS